MTRRLVAAAAIFLSLQAPASAHRLDEYLQAALISVAKARVQVSLRLSPGVAVSSAIITSIDTNGDGIISASEQHAYAERVLRDLSLRVDERTLTPRLVSAAFPEIVEMKEGLGQIQLEFIADLRPGAANRQLVFENHHQRAISVYLVNCLVPEDKDIRVTAQNRNENQSFYQLNYTEAGGSGSPRYPSRFPNGSFSGAIPSMFRLGVRHIAEG